MIVVAILALWILGRGIRAVAFRRDDERPGEALGLDFLVGAGLGSVVFFCVSLVSTTWAFRVLWVLVAAGAALSIRRGVPPKPERTAFWGALLLLAVVYALRGCFGSFTSDGYAHWGLKAKAMFLEGRVPTDLLRDTERIGYALPDYPFLWPSLEVWGYMNGANDTTVRLLGPAFLLALGAVFHGALRERCGPTLSFAATFLLLAPHQWIRIAGSGLAEPPFCAFVFAGFAAHSRRSAAQAGLLLGLAAWSKNEGLAAVAVGGLLLFRTPRLLPLYAATALAPIAPWIAYKQVHGISGYFAAGIAPLSEAPARLLLIGRSLLANVGEVKAWMLIWPVLALGVVLGFREIRRSVHLAGAGLLFLSYVVTLLLSPLDAAWQIPTALPRLLMHVEAPLLWCVAAASRDDIPRG